MERIVESLAGNQPYDGEVVWLAAHLHDWGGYPPWAKPGVDHVEASLAAAGPFLTDHEVPQAGALDSDGTERIRRTIADTVVHEGESTIQATGSFGGAVDADAACPPRACEARHRRAGPNGIFAV